MLHVYNPIKIADGTSEHVEVEIMSAMEDNTDLWLMNCDQYVKSICLKHYVFDACIYYMK